LGGVRGVGRNRTHSFSEGSFSIVRDLAVPVGAAGYLAQSAQARDFRKAKEFAWLLSESAHFDLF